MAELIRDYEKQPLGYIRNGSIKYREKPLKEDMVELYINQNMSVKELAKYLNYNERMLLKVLSEYGLKKDRKKVYEIQKKTLNKKGVDNVFQLEEVKQKSQQTILEKYGKKYYTQTDKYKDKNRKIRKEKYGNDPFCREKYRQTCKKKFGVENYDYIKYTNEQVRLLNDREYCIDFIKKNDIKNGLDFSEKSGIKQYASLTILHKHNLMSMFDYTVSKPEYELQEYLKGKGLETINHYKIDGKEIDIYIPALKIGIEFNGNYWHCEVFRDMNYHKNKSDIAERNGVFLYHIFEYEWNTRKQQILNQLNNLLGLNIGKIYARKCLIKMVSKKDKKIFLEDNHLQGNDHSLLYYGLYYNDELVSLMTFSKPHNTNKYEWELCRFCSKANYNVIGGASRLLKAFIKDYKPSSIISYSMISHTRGNLYQMLGFNCEAISKPSYVWYKSNDIKTRYQTRVKDLKRKGFIGNTEVDIMHNLGYSRIYDCGNKVWTWKNNLTNDC